MTKRAYFDEITKAWIFVDVDGDSKKAPQLVPDDVVKSLRRAEEYELVKCREVRKQSQRIRTFAEEFMMRQKRELEKVPQTVQPKVVRIEPRLGERYRESSGHGVYTYVPSLKEKTATLVKDILGRKVSPAKMILRLQWLTEEALNVSK